MKVILKNFLNRLAKGVSNTEESREEFTS